MKKYYAQIISTADSRPYVVREQEFETEAEAKAYVLGCQEGVYQADPDNDDVSASVSDVPAEDEP